MVAGGSKSPGDSLEQSFLILSGGHMKESDHVDIAWGTLFDYLNVFNEAAVYPLKAVDQINRLQRTAEIEEPRYDSLAGLSISKPQHKVDK